MKAFERDVVEKLLEMGMTKRVINQKTGIPIRDLSLLLARKNDNLSSHRASKLLQFFFFVTKTNKF